MAVASNDPSNPIPDHIPAGLVRELSYVRGATTTAQPHREMQRHQQFPEIFYAPNSPTGGGAWIFRRVEHCREIYLDTEHFTNRGFAPFPKLTGGDWKMIPIELDPPVHSRYRNILNPLLGPKAIAALDEKLVLFARDLVSAFKDRGNCDFMQEFACKFPIQIFLELMGLPLDKTEEFLTWERGMLYGSSIEEATVSAQAVVEYLNGEIAARRAAPGDDFIGHALRAEVDGQKLDDKEMLGICFTLFIGGMDTVLVHLGHLFRHLAEHPADQDYLRANPNRIPDAIDELMRIYGSAGGIRGCIKDKVIGDVTVREGDKVVIFTALSGRDPAEFAAPDEVRFDRKSRHLSFGYGPHLCIGMHLARREMRIAMETVLEMLPPFRIAPGAEIVSEMFGMLQPHTLPLVWKT